MGRYIFTPEIFELIDETEVGINDEIHLIDALTNWTHYMD